MTIAESRRMLAPGGPEWPATLLAGREAVPEDAMVDIAGDQDHESSRVPPAAGSTARPPAGSPSTPTALWVEGGGRLDQLAERTVAVIGTRAATPYGMHVAGDLAHGLAVRGWTVLAGGGFGIEAAAHRGALAADGPTVAVLAGGLDQLYPSAHEAMFRRIRGGGLLVTQQPPEAVVTRARTLLRDELIAALATAVVLVEALPRSTCLRIIGHAETQGRRVLAVPGPVTSTASFGCHQLLRTGRAQLVDNAASVIAHLQE